MPSYSSDDAAAMSRVLHHLEKHPEEIHNAELEALQAFVTSLGGRLPPKPTASSPPKPTASSPPKAAAAQADEDAHDPEKWEEDFLDHSHDVRANADANPSEADEERAMELKGEAQDAASDGNLSEAIAKMTQALTLTPNKAMYWALRADYFLQSKKPNAAIADATKALSLNNENARAHRVRGTAYRHLCRWEESALDLNAAQRVDFNESVDALLKVVQPKANHARDRKRKQELDEQNARQEALRRQRERELEEQREEEARKHAESSSSFPGAGGAAGGFPGGMPPRGGMPGGMPGGFPGGMPPGADQLFSDPEIMAAMQDPDTAAKLQMMMQNPAMAMQFMNDPKVGPVIQKIMAKMMGGGAGGGMPGGFPGGMPGGFPGGMPGGFPGGMGGGGAPPRGGGFSSSAGPRGAAQSSYQSSAQQQRPSSNAKPAADDLD